VASDLPKTSWKRETPFRLGGLEIHPASCEVKGRRGLERLRPLLMDILLRLAADPGEVVRRETLLEDVWPRRMVNDEVLSRAIAELRTALGDDARVARYIETLPKMGYRLVAPVEEIVAEAAPEPDAPALPAAAPAPRRRAPWIAAGIAIAGLVALGGWWLARPAAPATLANLEQLLKTARPFTSDPGIELSPRFSHDGKRVAFALAEGGESRIVVQAVDGSSRTFVGGLSGLTRLGPVFFPGGRRIAYWKSDEQDCAIVEHDLETTLERKLLDCTLSPRSRFDLSPDGRWMVFAATRPHFPSALWLLELDHGTPVALTTPEPGVGDDLFPRFSPDGKRIAFFRGGESHRAPWVVTRGDPASARAIGKVEGLAYGLAWLGPEGPLLAAADWLGFRALNTVDIASGETRLAGARGARFPDVGPHGELVYESATYSANLWRLDNMRGAAPRQLWRSTRYSSQPEISPDGKRAVFASNRDGADAIYVSALDGEPRRIAFGEQLRYLRPHWSADGRSIYAVRTGNLPAMAQEAVRIPSGGGTAEVLTGVGHAAIDVREGGDGKLYWGELAGNAMRLVRAPLAALDQVERLPLPLVSQYQLSAGRIAFMQPQLPGITICGLETLACEPTGADISGDEMYHWTLGARAIYLRATIAETSKLARYDLARRAITQSWDFFPSGAGASIAVSPDEKILLLAREEPPAIDLMIAR